MSGEIYTDQPGHFPVKSSNGRKCGMLLYDYDSSFNLEYPPKIRTQAEILCVYKKTAQTFDGAWSRTCPSAAGKPISGSLERVHAGQKYDFQLVTPYGHHQNYAEHSIGIWKYHFISGLASLDPNFLVRLLDCLIDQACLTLNSMW